MGHISDRSDKFVQKIFGPKRPPVAEGDQPPPQVSKNQEMLKRLNRRKKELLNDRRKV